MIAACLYCGKKLGWVCNTTYAEDKDKPPRVCGAVRYRYQPWGSERFTCKSTKFSGLSGLWTCAEEGCNAEHNGRRSVTSRVHRYKERGPNGDGLFCSKTHGWRFGILAARAGYKRTAS